MRFQIFLRKICRRRRSFQYCAAVNGGVFTLRVAIKKPPAPGKGGDETREATAMRTGKESITGHEEKTIGQLWNPHYQYN